MPDFHLLTVNWYRQNARILPWRSTKNPYFIWLSEIILQQTRVNQGLEYYLKFINAFPTVNDLADADEQIVLRLWQGLGYYSRARNLHAAAKMIASEMNGNFPTKYEDIRKLKGIGDYTAAAIASFAFDLAQPVVDGNVYRVISRVFDISTPIDTTEGKKLFAEMAKELLGDNPPAIHNQAIMEFGALQCVPSNPDCDRCPLQDQCLSYRNNTIKERPVKAKKTAVRKRFFHFVEFEEKGNTIIDKRTEKDIWQHLFQFPLIELSSETPIKTVQKQLEKSFGVRMQLASEEIKHVLSHQHLHTYFWKSTEFPSVMEERWKVIKRVELGDYPLPRVIDRYLMND